jgi:hypothetical protein
MPPVTQEHLPEGFLVRHNMFGTFRPFQYVTFATYIFMYLSYLNDSNLLNRVIPNIDRLFTDVIYASLNLHRLSTLSQERKSCAKFARIGNQLYTISNNLTFTLVARRYKQIGTNTIYSTIKQAFLISFP